MAVTMGRYWELDLVGEAKCAWMKWLGYLPTFVIYVLESH